jgi:hypothetical protein
MMTGGGVAAVAKIAPYSAKSLFSTGDEMPDTMSRSGLLMSYERSAIAFLIVDMTVASGPDSFKAFSARE